MLIIQYHRVAINQFTSSAGTGSSLVSFGWFNQFQIFKAVHQLSEPVMIARYGPPLHQYQDIPIDNRSDRSFRRTFLVHLLCKLVEKYAMATNRYTHRHIPNPLGYASDLSGYLLERVPGTEGFTESFIEAEELLAFSGVFNLFGINILHDTADANDGNCAQNLMVWKDGTVPLQNKYLLPRTWMRIDYESSSLQLTEARTAQVVLERKHELSNYLSPAELDLMLMIVFYLNLSYLSTMTEDFWSLIKSKCQDVLPAYANEVLTFQKTLLTAKPEIFSR